MTNEQVEIEQVKMYIGDLVANEMYSNDKEYENALSFWNLLELIGRLKLSIKLDFENIENLIIDNLAIFVRNVSDYIDGSGIIQIMHNFNPSKSGQMMIDEKTFFAMDTRNSYQNVNTELCRLLNLESSKGKNDGNAESQKLNLMRRFNALLYNADMEILLNKKKVAAFQKLNVGIEFNIPHYMEDWFKEIYWWYDDKALRDYPIDPKYEDTCWMPGYFQCVMLAEYQHGIYTGQLKGKITRHISSCHDCNVIHKTTTIN